MNANELANALESMTTGWFDDLTLNQSAIMLRQLKSENDALRKTVDSLFYGLDSSLKLNKAQAERQQK